jgi:hypothetical protein
MPPGAGRIRQVQREGCAFWRNNAAQGQGGIVTHHYLVKVAIHDGSEISKILIDADLRILGIEPLKQSKKPLSPV